MQKLRLLVFLAVLLTPNVALAYIGPGTGISVIGSLMALVGGLILVVIGFVWYPIKSMMKKRNKTHHEVNLETKTVAETKEE